MKTIANKDGHGGKRAGAGKPRTSIDGKRVAALVALKVTQREIAKRFGVSRDVIRYHLKPRTK